MNIEDDVIIADNIKLYKTPLALVYAVLIIWFSSIFIPFYNFEEVSFLSSTDITKISGIDIIQKFDTILTFEWYQILFLLPALLFPIAIFFIAFDVFKNPNKAVIEITKNSSISKHPTTLYERISIVLANLISYIILATFIYVWYTTDSITAYFYMIDISIYFQLALMLIITISWFIFLKMKGITIN